MGTVCVEIAVRDDRRLLDAVDSLAAQRRRPDRILIAASPATPPELLAEAERRAAPIPVVVTRTPGGVVDARAASLALISETTTAFLDSDERAPPEWLGTLVAPIEGGGAGFAGGPTRPARPATTPVERYAALLEEAIYADLVPRSIGYVPLQNSAWNTELLRRLGFDPRIPFAEDHDLESRAIAAGALGTFVPAAFVYHDLPTDSSFFRWARKRYRYLVAMAMSLVKNGELKGRLEERRRPVRHPLRYVEATMKPFALLHGTLRWRRLARAGADA
jgi:GT2 family glycosyltransferase